jgi:hypothetical protein
MTSHNNDEETTPILRADPAKACYHGGRVNDNVDGSSLSKGPVVAGDNGAAAATKEKNRCWSFLLIPIKSPKTVRESCMAMS